jgi:hypothetical protein
VREEVGREVGDGDDGVEGCEGDLTEACVKRSNFEVVP